MLSAEPYSGKTMLMLGMALSLDTGRPLFGSIAPTQQRRVLFIGQDAPTWDYAGQACKLIRGYGIDEKEAQLLETDLLLNEGILITDPAFFNPNTPGGWLDEWHKITDFEVLMLDTLITFHNLDENINQHMQSVMKIMKAIRDRYGCTVIFSHHTNKVNQDNAGASPNYRSRGASTIPASVDFHFQLSRRGSRVFLLMPKGRGAKGEGTVKFFDIEETEQGVVKLVGASPPESTPSTKVGQEILALLDAPKSRAQLVDELVALGTEPEEAAKVVHNSIQALRRAQKIEQAEYGTWRRK